MTSFLKVEDLTRGVKSVQDAKSSLEHRLNDRRTKRQEAEKVLESVNAKFSQVRQLHSKMLETVKVAQHKVSKSQAQCTSSEKHIAQKNETLKKLGEQIKQGQEDRGKDIMKFEEELSKLSSFLKDAKNIYSGKNLQESMANANNNAVMTQNQLTPLMDDEAAITQRLQTMDLNTSDSTECKLEKEEIWDMIQGEQMAALQCIQTLNDEIETIRMNMKLRYSETSL